MNAKYCTVICYITWIEVIVKMNCKADLHMNINLIHSKRSYCIITASNFFIRERATGRCAAPEGVCAPVVWVPRATSTAGRTYFDFLQSTKAGYCLRISWEYSLQEKEKIKTVA